MTVATSGITFPISFIYFPLFLLLIYFLARALANLYILVRFGEPSVALHSVLLVFFVGAAVIFGLLFGDLSRYDLTVPVKVPINIPGFVSTAASSINPGIPSFSSLPPLPSFPSANQ